jgi:hypothetical protein
MGPSGTTWECARLYKRVDDSCTLIAIPANAYVDDSRYSRGWRCRRGYREADGACVAV